MADDTQKIKCSDAGPMVTSELPHPTSPPKYEPPARPTSFDRRCVACSLDLEQRPCILVEGFPHCFRCAKSEVAALEVKAEAAFQFELKCFQAAEEKERIRQRDINERLINPLKAMAWGAAVFGGFAFTTSRHETASCVVAGAIIGVWLTCQFNAETRSKFGPSKLNLADWNLRGARKIDYELVKNFGDPGTYRSNYRVRILMRDKNTCQNCGSQPGDEFLEVHHIQTRADNGPDHPANLITLCHSCHDREEWFGHVRAYPKTMS